MFKSDQDIEKEFSNFEILGIEINKGGDSGYINIAFPNGEEHVGGGADEVCDHWIKYNNGKIAFDNWYPENIYILLVSYINDAIRRAV